LIVNQLLQRQLTGGKKRGSRNTADDIGALKPQRREGRRMFTRRVGNEGPTNTVQSTRFITVSGRGKRAMLAPRYRAQGEGREKSRNWKTTSLSTAGGYGKEKEGLPKAGENARGV